MDQLDRDPNDGASTSSMLSGDFRAYSHLLDCMYKVGSIDYN